MSEGLPLRHALLLGLLQGPTELLPVSSSAHTVLVPELLGWPAAQLPPEQAKTFEIALHCGAALGLIIAMPHELLGGLRRPVVLALSLVPAAAIGFTFERPIERRLSGPSTIAANLFVGGLAMAVADKRGGQTRQVADARGGDGVALGLAQALALLPGVSRNGATLTALRARGFSRADAQTLSWQVGLPPILAATALKGRRMASEGVPPGLGRPLVAGVAAAFVSTLACSPLLSRSRRARPLLGFALYRATLAALVVIAKRQREHLRGPLKSKKKVPLTRF